MSKICKGIMSKVKAFSLEKALKSNCGEARLGCLQLGNGQGSGSGSHRTPMYFIHTQTGTIPHITTEVFKMIWTDSSSPPLQISIDSTMKYVESIDKCGIGRFIGFEGLPVFLTIHDQLQGLRNGHNDKFGIALWSRHGKTSLSPERFKELVKAYKCSASQILSDYDVVPESSVKRLQKSLHRAEEYTKQVLDKTEANHFLTIEASWFKVNEELAKKTVAKLLEVQHQAGGIVLAGLYDRFLAPAQANSKPKEGKRNDLERLGVCADISEEFDTLNVIMKVLPKDLPKYAPGPFKLAHIVDLVARGVDIFDSSVASRMADGGEALLLDLVEKALPQLSPSVGKLPKVEESLPERKFERKESPEQMSIALLKEKRFFDDFRPISEACTCYTCRKHTRSYVHHLYATDELLGPVLVQIHNLTAFDRFFQILRGVIEDSQSPEELQGRFDTIMKLVSESNLESSDELEIKCKN